MVSILNTGLIITFMHTFFHPEFDMIHYFRLYITENSFLKRNIIYLFTASTIDSTESINQRQSMPESHLVQTLAKVSTLNLQEDVCNIIELL